MAYKRTYRRRYGRRRYYKRSGKSSSTMWSLAKRAASGVVKYYLNPEYKFLDFNTSATPGTGGFIQSISNIAIGDDNVSRDGNSIKVTRLNIQGTINKHSTATSTKVRIIVFTDASSNGSVPVNGDLMQGTGPDSFLNRVNGSRFTVLYNKAFIVDSDDPKKMFHITRKLQHHIHYLDGTNAASSLGQGPIYINFISDETTNLPTISYSSRLRFLDN